MRFPRPVRDGLAEWLRPDSEVRSPHKLTDDDVTSLRRYAQQGDSFSAIGRMFGVTGSTVARLARGELRPRVGGPIEGRDYDAPSHRRSPFRNP